MIRHRVSLAALVASALILTAAAATAADPAAPIVTMSISLPDGRIQELTAPESGLATVTVDGTEYGFRPTIQDSSPWNRIVITVFKTASSQAVGEIEVKRGMPAVALKTSPAFKVAVPKVTAAAATSPSTE